MLQGDDNDDDDVPDMDALNVDDESEDEVPHQPPCKDDSAGSSPETSACAPPAALGRNYTLSERESFRVQRLA